MPLFSEYTLEQFENLVGYDVSIFLSDFVDFTQNFKQNIIDYYQGQNDDPPVESLEFLNSLLSEVDKIISDVEINKDNFNSFADWNLLIKLEEIKVKLETTYNISKYLRSSINVTENYNPNPKTDITLKQNTTLEQLAHKVGSQDRHNDWINIALDNNLKQEDYDRDGGNILSVSLQNSISDSFYVETVIDNLQGKNVLGKDIKKRIQFDGNQNDLKILSFEDTFLQSVFILANLRKNDNPYVPEDGISSNLVVGTTLGSLTFPKIFRQIANSFSTDDTIINFKVLDLLNENTSLEIKYEVESKLAEITTNDVISF